MVNFPATSYSIVSKYCGIIMSLLVYAKDIILS